MPEEVRVMALVMDGVRDPVLVAVGAVIKVVLMAQVDFVFAQSVAKKSYISRGLNALL
ncbi:MAG: hypothetical protein ABFS38_12515 [Bacteroidota bacterium]